MKLVQSHFFLINLCVVLLVVCGALPVFAQQGAPNKTECFLGFHVALWTGKEGAAPPEKSAIFSDLRVSPEPVLSRFDFVRVSFDSAGGSPGLRFTPSTSGRLTLKKLSKKVEKTSSYRLVALLNHRVIAAVRIADAANRANFFIHMNDREEARTLNKCLQSKIAGPIKEKKKPGFDF